MKATSLIISNWPPPTLKPKPIIHKTNQITVINPPVYAVPRNSVLHLLSKATSLIISKWPPKLRSSSLLSVSVTQWPPKKLKPSILSLNKKQRVSRDGKSKPSSKLLGSLSSVSVTQWLPPKPQFLPKYSTSKVIMHGNHRCRLRHPRL